MMKKLVAILLLTLFTSACARQALIVSEPPGATVIVNGQPVGETPCRFDYSLSSGGNYEVTIEKEGYEIIRHSVKADKVDRKARHTWLAAGVVWSPLWLGTLFTKKLKENYAFVMKPAAPAYTASVNGPGPARPF